MKQRFAPIAAAIAGVVLLALVAWLLTDETADSDWEQPGVTIDAGSTSEATTTEASTTEAERAVNDSATVNDRDTADDGAMLVAPLQSHLPTIGLSELPDEALLTLRLIHTEGPFPYSQDDTTFQNREAILPDRERGHYREYTVETPGLSHRGARRIVAGDHGERYYTEDHYESFSEIADLSAHEWLRPFELEWLLEAVTS